MRILRKVIPIGFCLMWQSCLVVDHGLSLDFGHDGCGQTCVQHEVILGCMSWGIGIDGSMGPDFCSG